MKTTVNLIIRLVSQNAMPSLFFRVLLDLDNLRIWLFQNYVKSVQIQSFFWSVFSRIRAEYGEIRSISPYSVRMRENIGQKKLLIWKLSTQWATFFSYLLSRLYYMLFIFREIASCRHGGLLKTCWNILISTIYFYSNQFGEVTSNF